MNKTTKLTLLTISSLLLTLTSLSKTTFGQEKPLDNPDKSINKAKEINPNIVANAGLSKSSKLYAIRLKPGQDIKLTIENFAKENSIKAGFIVTAVGSLQSATIRLADQKDPSSFNEKMEIVSLVGTISLDGVHFHISLADKTGKTFGGHMSDGCKVYTTAEIIIGSLDDIVFSREQDPQTGFRELIINPTSEQKK